jgi:uncharacterized protein (TIGR02117 family)
VARRRRKSKAVKWLGRLAAAVLALPVLYLLAALAGSLVPVNRAWKEPAAGTTIYLIDNGIHADLVMPIAAQGLDWGRLFPLRDFPKLTPGPAWIAFGAGEENVYLNTPTWWDVTPRTAWHAIAGGKRVMHVEYVPGINVEVRQIRLRAEEYRRLWAAIRSDFVLDARGRPIRIDHPGYGPNDGFYRANGKASALRTCNSWVADKLRLAGVKTSAWPPFEQGLLW